MNSHRLTIARSVLALTAVTGLTLAACGGDDATTAGDGTAPSTSQPDGSGPALGPASVTADAQASDGTRMVVASVDLPAAGFIAVHGDGGGKPGAVIGHSELLPAGKSSDVAITFDAPLTADATVYPMVHIDVNGNGQYDFAPPDITTDAPGELADGNVAMVATPLTIGAGGAGGAGSGAEITIASFAFSGATEVAAGTTVTVTNNDSATHTWTADDGAFDSGPIKPGDSFQFTFDTAGTYAFHCNFHPDMTGTITVTG